MSKGDNSLLRLIIVDETWFHNYVPEYKLQSIHRIGPDYPRLKKFKTQSSAGKVMATVIWVKSRGKVNK